jgi:hypothetical protein
MTTRPALPAFPIIAEEKQSPFQTISLDLITDLPLLKGYDSILTIVDQDVAKPPYFFPVIKVLMLWGWQDSMLKGSSHSLEHHKE